MEIIDFKAGPQKAGTIVRDTFGGLWTVLKDIGYATAQPREGAYYTRYTEPVAPVAEPILLELDARDFRIEEATLNGVVQKTIRIIR